MTDKEFVLSIKPEYYSFQRGDKTYVIKNMFGDWITLGYSLEDDAWHHVAYYLRKDIERKLAL